MIFNRQERDRLDFLQRRQNTLKSRLATYSASGNDSYTKREITVLGWVLCILCADPDKPLAEVVMGARSLCGRPWPELEIRMPGRSELINGIIGVLRPDALATANEWVTAGMIADVVSGMMRARRTEESQ